MSANRPLQCASLLSRAAHPVRHSQQCLYAGKRHNIETPARRRLGAIAVAQQRYASSKASKDTSSKAQQAIRPYSEEEKAKLRQNYTAEQMAAIEAGEAAVDAEDLWEQGALRQGKAMSPDYLDDFAKLEPVVDSQPLAPQTNYDPAMRLKNEDDIAADLGRWLESLPEDADPVEWEKFLDSNRAMVGDEEAERNSTSYVRPELPKLEGAHVRRVVREDRRDDGREITPFLRRLSKQIGLEVDEIKRLRTKVLVQRRVANQTHMGKIASQYYLCVAGNGKGMLGIGEGKSQEPDEGLRQAQLNAIRNMVPIPRYEGRTIYGDVKGKVGATELELFTRPPGFGIRTQSKIYEMCKCAGISDIAARVTRARNPMNTVKAAFQALSKQRDPEQIARARGKKLVDVRKVYYAGNV